MVNYDGSPALSNCILWGNIDNDGMDESAQIHVDGPAPIVNYCCIQGWTGGLGGTGNLGDDPLLTDPDGADNIPGTGDDDLHLQPGSPCIDAGDNDAVPPDDQLDLDGDCDTGERMPIDLDGNERFADDPATEPDPGHGDKPVVDIGAYEFGSTPPPLDDCNKNGVPDLCDIDSGTSPDDNANGVPDECEPCLEPGDSGRHCTADIYPNNHDGVWDYFDDGDCVVDLWDLAQLLGNYGTTSGATREDGDICPPPDGDGAVGIGDLAELLGQYRDDCN